MFYDRVPALMFWRMFIQWNSASFCPCGVNLGGYEGCPGCGQRRYSSRVEKTTIPNGPTVQELVAGIP